MAIRLDEMIRTWPLRDEQVGLTGHWHILSGIIATIILLLYADLAGLKGKARQWFGWVVTHRSDLAFAAVTLFETKRLYVSEADSAAARGRHHDRQRRGAGDGADRPGCADGLAADRSVPPQRALGEGGARKQAWKTTRRRWGDEGEWRMRIE